MPGEEGVQVETNNIPVNPTSPDSQPITVDSLASIINQAVSGAVNQAIGGIHSYVDGKINSQNSANVKLAKDVEKLKKKKVTFKFKGNEEQVLFNESISDKLEEAQRKLSENSAPYPIIVDVLKDIKKRNKLIKIADNSDAGWYAVDEYVTCPLASDSDDDKKIRKSEVRGLAKKKKSQ